jgi:hypothetical protein
LRDFRKFNKQRFLDDIKQISWDEILAPNKSLDKKTQDAVSTLNKIVDNHAPVKTVTQPNKSN